MSSQRRHSNLCHSGPWRVLAAKEQVLLVLLLLLTAEDLFCHGASRADVCDPAAVCRDLRDGIDTVSYKCHFLCRLFCNRRHIFPKISSGWELYGSILVLVHNIEKRYRFAVKPRPGNFRKKYFFYSRIPALATAVASPRGWQPATGSVLGRI